MIRLSPKHGVNPSIAQCFYCLDDKNEIVLPGKLPDDREAPHHGVWDYAPCDKCREFMAQGIILISVDEGKTDNPRNPYRSGGFAVVKEEAIQRLVKDKELCSKICQSRVAFLPDEVWDMLGLSDPTSAESS